MSLAMSRAEREAFLADTHVGIVSIAEEGRGPLAVPVWYRYAPGGDVLFATADTSRKVALLRKAGRASLCVQTESAPYLYVSVEGPVRFDRVDFDRDSREMAIRYLGPQMGEAYLAATYPEGVRSEVLVRLRPARWWSADFRKFTRRSLKFPGARARREAMAARTPEERIYRAVMRIPPGRVATYGQIARVAGMPRHHRQVGRALRGLVDDGLVPWHRVVSASGTISLRSADGSAEREQRQRLAREGVALDARGRVSLARFQWKRGVAP